MTLGDTLGSGFLVTRSASVSGQPLDIFDVLVVRYDTKDTVWPHDGAVKRFVRTAAARCHRSEGTGRGRAIGGASHHQANRLASAFDCFEIEADKQVRGEPAVAPLRTTRDHQGIDIHANGGPGPDGHNGQRLPCILRW